MTLRFQLQQRRNWKVNVHGISSLVENSFSDYSGISFFLYTYNLRFRVSLNCQLLFRNRLKLIVLFLPLLLNYADVNGITLTEKVLFEIKYQKKCQKWIL